MSVQPKKNGAAKAQAGLDDASVVAAKPKVAEAEPDPKAESDAVKKAAQQAQAKQNRQKRAIAAARAAQGQTNSNPQAAAPEQSNLQPQPNPPAKPNPPAQAPAAAKKPPGARALKVSKPVNSAKLKRRHWTVIFSFFCYVGLPIVVVAYYLWVYAEDQYASTVAFSVRTEESSTALELLGGITDLSGSSSSDTDILYQFLQSQKLVEDIDAQIDLRTMWSKPENDPIFAFDQDGKIEDLLEHWIRFVAISYDDSAGLIEVETRAFDPVDATLIAQTLYDESSKMINGLSDIAREDAIRYAREELDSAVLLLQGARQEVTVFRNLNQLVDPSIDVNTQVGLVGSLEAQLAEALIDLDMLPSQRQDDPRFAQAQLRIDVIQRRIDEERNKLGAGKSGEGEVFAELFGEYERLVVEREFAEQRFLSAQIAYDSALSEARRQSRYLAAYVQPTSAESARYPKRLTLTFVYGLFISLVWATIVLVLYAIKDRR